ncbi:F420-non-reducing hydrogenase subunit A [Desulfoscipio geothermicus DSM 3669]|uniref:F420-non-reducing hydrogenase subunit A n=1 Tax=Desulfoscipio geothermicus DSM 3669 TaxID=1121426 RepID=A0A1I6E7A0_9FIRM|nr:F420-non-reducing hydrogenase subunit A [Desulfoscipio geothermicus DSM 3669]
MASGKANDAVFNVRIPPAAKKLRELFYSAHFVHSHIAHFYALAAPDFVLGPDADPAERNILGVVSKVGLDIGGEVIKHRAYAQEIQALLAGKATHPVWVVPGGVSKGLTEEERRKVEEMAQSCVKFAEFSLQLFEDVVLKNKGYVDLILSEGYRLVTNYMGLVDDNNKVNFYDGKVRIVDPDGVEIGKYSPPEYLNYVSEHVEPWSYLKFPYLKQNGWTGFSEGKGTGIYQAAPLARLNAAEGMATPLAQEAYEKMYDTLGGKPAHAILAAHWARLVELLYAAERLLELSKDPQITGTDIRVIPTGTPDEGVGIIEAPRGTLTHHYKTDANGMVTAVNLIVGTTNNHAPIYMAVKKAARAVIKPGVEITHGLLNMVEMAFRSYDPCFSCATHALFGEMPLKVVVYGADGSVLSGR